MAPETKPVPVMVSVWLLLEDGTGLGETLPDGFTVTVAEPDLLESCVEVAESVAVPVAAGVNTPLLVMPPMLTGLTAHATALLKFPVPSRVALQAEVWEVVIGDGEQLTETPVIVDGALTVTVADPDWLPSWVEIAVMVAVPAAVGVKTPALLMAPIVDGLTDHVTALL